MALAMFIIVFMQSYFLFFYKNKTIFIQIDRIDHIQ